MIKSLTRLLPALTLAVAISGCAEQVTTRNDVSLDSVARDAPRVMAMGDSFMAWHTAIGRSIPDAIAANLGTPVESRAVSGARVLYPLPISGALGMKISKQYKPGDWDWVVLNGGGNDLWLGCGCVLCDGKMNRLIGPEGRSGEIAKTVAKIRQSGAKVIYVGYLRSPGRGSIIDHCRDDGNELEARIARMAEQMDGVHFLSVADLVPHGDRSYHSADMIHPSIKASSEIGRAVAEIIRGQAEDA